MNNIFYFGEKINKYDVRVLNENEARAAAGLLFLFAMIAFLNSWLIGDFTITKTFVCVFLVDFIIRILINPKFAPSLIIARLFVKNQKVNYVGATQKKFAWLIGLVLAIVMFYMIVLNNIIGPLNLLVCLFCLALLFFEAAFGTCIGCKLYNLFNKEKAQLCPGNTCELNEQEDIAKTNTFQIVIAFIFIIFIYFVFTSPFINPKDVKALKQEVKKVKIYPDDCQPPQWAIDMGHRDKWKLHNCTKL